MTVSNVISYVIKCTTLFLALGFTVNAAAAQTNPTEVSCALLGHRAAHHIVNACMPAHEAVIKAAEELSTECATAPDLCGPLLLQPQQVLPLGLAPYGRFASGLSARFQSTSDGINQARGCLFYLTGSLVPQPSTCDIETQTGSALDWTFLNSETTQSEPFSEQSWIVDLPEITDADFYFSLHRLVGAYPTDALYRTVLEDGRIYLRYGFATGLDGDLDRVTLTHHNELPVTAINLIYNSLTDRIIVRLNKTGEFMAQSVPNTVISHFESFRLPQIKSVNAISIELDFGAAGPSENFDFDRFGALRFFGRLQQQGSITDFSETLATLDGSDMFATALMQLELSALNTDAETDRQMSSNVSENNEYELFIEAPHQFRDAKFPRLVAFVLFNQAGHSSLLEAFEVLR